jgi:hypothetical protein
MINTDNFHYKGTSHIFCQDYSISGLEPIPYAIVTDGCSSSENSDIGAAILARSAQKILNFFYTCEIEDDFAKCLGLSIIMQADIIRKDLGLNKNCLDASLLIAYRFNNKYIITIYGDGAYCVTYPEYTLENNIKNFYMTIYEIKYAKEAPYYLSYLIDKDRRKEYEKNIGKLKTPKTINKKTVSIFENSNTNLYENIYEYNYNHILCNTYLDNDGLDIFRILISSDGLSSFRNNNTKEITPLENTLKDFTNFKVLKGEVMKRTAKKVLKNYAKENIYPYDDISFGALIDLSKENNYEQRI